MSEVWNQLLEKQCYKNKATEGINLLTAQAINQCGGGPGPWRGPVPLNQGQPNSWDFCWAAHVHCKITEDSPPPNFPHHPLFWKLRYCWQNLVMCGVFPFLKAISASRNICHVTLAVWNHFLTGSYLSFLQRSLTAGARGWGRGQTTQQNEETSRVMEMFSILSVVVKHLHTATKIHHQTVHFKWMNLT